MAAAISTQNGCRKPLNMPVWRKILLRKSWNESQCCIIVQKLYPYHCSLLKTVEITFQDGRRNLSTQKWLSKTIKHARFGVNFTQKVLE